MQKKMKRKMRQSTKAKVTCQVVEGNCPSKASCEYSICCDDENCERRSRSCSDCDKICNVAKGRKKNQLNCKEGCSFTCEELSCKDPVCQGTDCPDATYRGSCNYDEGCRLEEASCFECEGGTYPGCSESVVSGPCHSGNCRDLRPLHRKKSPGESHSHSRVDLHANFGSFSDGSRYPLSKPSIFTGEELSLFNGPFHAGHSGSSSWLSLESMLEPDDDDVFDTVDGGGSKDPFGISAEDLDFYRLNKPRLLRQRQELRDKLKLQFLDMQRRLSCNDPFCDCEEGQARCEDTNYNNNNNDNPVKNMMS